MDRVIWKANKYASDEVLHSLPVPEKRLFSTEREGNERKIKRIKRTVSLPNVCYSLKEKYK